MIGLTELLLMPTRALGFAVRSSTRAWRETRRPEIPTQRPLPTLLPSVLLDELALVLGRLVVPERPFSHDELSRARQELDAALSILEANDCLEDPASFHPSPPPIDDLVAQPGSFGPVRFEILAFENESHSSGPIEILAEQSAG